MSLERITFPCCPPCGASSTSATSAVKIILRVLRGGENSSCGLDDDNFGRSKLRPISERLSPVKENLSFFFSFLSSLFFFFFYFFRC